MNYQTYKNLKHLIHSIKSLDILKVEGLKESTKLYLKELESKCEAIKNGDQYIKAYINNKKYYWEFLGMLKALKIPNIDPFEKYLNLKDPKKICLAYTIIEKVIVENVTLWNLDFDDERDLVKLLITILYNGGSFYRKDLPYKEFWGKMKQYKEEAKINKKGYKDPLKTIITNARRDFGKLFRYYFWDEDKYKFILSDMSKKTKRGNFKGPVDVPIVEFLESDSKLIKFAKEFMKENATNPMKETNHVYLSVMKFGKHNRIYIGKASEKTDCTRQRWGYGSGHLFEVFHYIVRKGKYNLPRQLTDLWTLYYGPDYQFILTLNSDVALIKGKIKLDHYEKCYQYYFEFEKEELDVQGYTHEKLSYKSKDELPKVVKDIYDKITHIKKK